MKLWPAHLQNGSILISLCGTIYALLICSKGTSRYWYHFVVSVMSHSYAARELTYTLRDTSYGPVICSQRTYSQTCSKRPQFEHRKKWSSKTGDPLKKAQFIRSFNDRTRKRWPLNTGDCLLEVTSWEGLTVLISL